MISLKQQDFTIEAMADLKDKRVLAFQDASKIFPDLGWLHKANPLYQEMANQESQVALLFKQRVDLIVLDRSIFYYWRNSINYVNTGAGVTFHELSSISAMEVDSPTQTVFKDKTLRDDFNFGLQRLRDTGLYQKIVSRYLRGCAQMGRHMDYRLSEFR
ncbi:transporter substrate-binding domain-containing protein [Thalassomonas sp. RHCl1]|uniref:transporter substrate-binding domain-containing protein n=1 Tax=Thalassomonas sp. RHCl1 TaxID=2995320 RepID=UPI00248B8F4A|nr:transporter substrate-binding domain-containing protein [Thalassomonas sp. RHCl1]